MLHTADGDYIRFEDVEKTIERELKLAADRACALFIDQDAVFYKEIQAFKENTEARLRSVIQNRNFGTDTNVGSKCDWSMYDGDSGAWEGSCGICWNFIDGTPVENEVSFCPKCGKPVVQHLPEEDEASV